MKNYILDLWENDRLPIKDALYLNNGESFSLNQNCAVTIKTSPLALFSLEVFLLENPDEITQIDKHHPIHLKNGNYIQLGEGSYGAEGFIAYLNNNQDLLWVIYFEDSNPFIYLNETSSNSISVISSNGITAFINKDLLSYGM